MNLNCDIGIHLHISFIVFEIKKLCTILIMIFFLTVLRLGKGFEMLYAAKEGFYIKDFVIQTCVVLSRIASACFLFLDHILWLHRVKAINVDIKPISKLCNQFWVLSTIINLVRNAYDWNRIRLNQHSKHEDLPAGYVPELLPTALDTVKNSFDLLIPMNGLKYWNIAGVVQGTTGAISSVIGMMTIWDDRLKLQNR